MGAANDLRKLEFSDNRIEQESTINRLMDFDREYGLCGEELAAFEVLLKEFHEKYQNGLRVYRPDGNMN
ncbi:MAG: hypothetical protein AB7E74_13115 [Pirellulales bacterium]